MLLNDDYLTKEQHHATLS